MEIIKEKRESSKDQCDITAIGASVKNILDNGTFPLFICDYENIPYDADETKN